MISWKRLRAPCLVGTFAVLTLGASIASADTFSSTLSFTNATGAIGSGPFGNVLVTLVSPTTATIAFTADSGFTFGDGSSADANGSFTLTSISGNCPSCTYTNGGTGNVDGIGSFSAEVNSGDFSAGSRSTEITLTVTATGSTTWSSASQVLTANAAGFDAGAHVLSASTGFTGFAGEPAGPSSVPEPTAIILLGSSMIGLGAIVRRRRSSRLV